MRGRQHDDGASCEARQVSTNVGKRLDDNDARPFLPARKE
jgi:hypothetical protein